MASRFQKLPGSDPVSGSKPGADEGNRTRDLLFTNCRRVTSGTFEGICTRPLTATRSQTERHREGIKPVEIMGFFLVILTTLDGR